MRQAIILLVCCSICAATPTQQHNHHSTNQIENENRTSFVRKLLHQCDSSTDFFKCVKIKALKFAERAMKLKKMELFSGFDIVQVKDGNNNNNARSGRVLKDEDGLQSMENGDINDLLYDTALNFLESHAININLPKIVEEARRKKKDRHTGPFLAALAIKGVIMSMAYKSIAVMAGTALIIGKMALVLAAILGLKKLISGEKEKTTVEIVKHPTHSNSHSYSSSYEEGEGHYRRSMTSPEELLILERISRNAY